MIYDLIIVTIYVTYVIYVTHLILISIEFTMKFF